MSVQSITITGGQGGISSNTKSGFPNSCRFSKNLNIYDDGDSVTLNPQPIKDSGAIVTDLVKWMVDGTPFDTNRYALGDAGNFYQITSSGVWSLIGTVSVSSDSAHGNGLILFNNFVYITSDSEIARYGPLTSSPALTNGFIESLNLNKDTGAANTTASGQTYTLTTSNTTDSTHRITFTPSYDPIHKVDLNIDTIGTGNWTVNLNDSNGSVVATTTRLNASLSTGIQTFTFASPYARITPGQTYYLYVISSVADGKIVTSSTGDASTAYYQIYFKTLCYDADFHPIEIHTDGTKGIVVFGNEHYFATWDGVTYNPNKITLEPAYKVRTFMKDAEYLVGLCWRGTAIDAYETGKGFWWDGVASYYNYGRPITGGSPNAAVNFKDRVLSILGSNGNLNLGNEPYKLIAPMPKLTKGTKVEIAPGAMDVWQSKAQIGVAFNTTDGTGLEQGVYEFGSQTDRAMSYSEISTETLNFGYTISTGRTQGTNIRIGCVKAFGKEMYIGWYDGNQAGGLQYGTDKVSKSGNRALTGKWESLIEDKTIISNQLVSSPQTYKLARRVVISFLPLATGCTVTAKGKFERATTGGTNNDGWMLGTAATVGATKAEITLNGLGSARYKEIEYGFDCTSSSGNDITITSIYFEFDALEQERMDN